MSSLLGRSAVRPLNGMGQMGRAGGGRERGLAAVMGIFWLVSLVRVFGALLRHEAVGVEATLALVAVIAIPWLIWGRPGVGRGRRAAWR
jgi:hypothetical protein